LHIVHSAFAAANKIGATGLRGKSWPDLDMLPFGWLTDAGDLFLSFSIIILIPALQKKEAAHNCLEMYVSMLDKNCTMQHYLCYFCFVPTQHLGQ
jgi:hypothetical protein